MVIAWVLYVLLLMAQFVGVTATLLTLPGLWFMLLADIVFAVLTHLHFLGPRMLIALLLIAGIAEAIDIGMAGVLAKRAGGGRSGIIGALLGGIVGAFCFPLGPLVIVGILAGSFIGAFLLEWLFGRGAGSSLRIGAAATGGKALGMAIKVCFGLLMLVLTLIDALP